MRFLTAGMRFEMTGITEVLAEQGAGGGEEQIILHFLNFAGH